MPRILKDRHIDNLGRRYLAGETMTELAREVGVHVETLRKAFLRRGVYQKGKGPRIAPERVSINGWDNILARYLAGESENSLSAELGINRWTFRQRLLKSDVAPRGRSEAETMKWASMTSDKRRSQVAAAHAATRGRTVSIEEQEARARTKARTLTKAVPIEFDLIDMLSSRGIDTIPQMALGPYNVDVAIDTPPIAIEIFGGGWHAYGDHRALFHKRVKYLLNCNWSVIIIWLDSRRYPLGPAAVDYIVTFVKHLRSQPAGWCEYRMILGNGQSAPIRKSYLNTPADIKRLGCSTDAAGYHYFIAG